MSESPTPSVGAEEDSVENSPAESVEADQDDVQEVAPKTPPKPETLQMNGTVVPLPSPATNSSAEEGKEEALSEAAKNATPVAADSETSSSFDASATPTSNAAEESNGTKVRLPPSPEQPVVQRKQKGNSPKENSNSTAARGSLSDEDDDVTSKVSVALAAVAAAATATHKSPAEAAAQARAVAQSFLSSSSSSSLEQPPGAASSPLPSSQSAQGTAGNSGARIPLPAGGAATVVGGNPATMAVPRPLFRTVRLDLVVAQLRAKLEAVTLTESVELLLYLCGEDSARNSSFLRHLLLFEYFRCADEEEETKQNLSGNDVITAPSVNNTPSAGEEDDDDETPPLALPPESDTENYLASQAADRLLTVLKKLDAAYETLLSLLPPPSKKSKAQLTDPDDYESDEARIPVVPDLLPPCTSAQGDATLAFFRACTQGENEQVVSVSTHISSDDALSNSGTALTEGTVDESNNSQNTNSATSSPRPGSTMFSLFRRTAAPATTKATNNNSSSTNANNNPSTLSTGASILGTFRRRAATARSDEETKAAVDNNASSSSVVASEVGGCRPGEYVVKIEREMLGLTVENVLERTVVRTVLAGGPAKKAGAKVGSLIVKVGNIETRNLTHFETIDELRQSQRPLYLVLKQLSEDSLRAAREEMGRLIRGAGFGAVTEASHPHTIGLGGNNSHHGEAPDQSYQQQHRPLIAADLRLDAYTTLIRRRVAAAAELIAGNASGNRNKKEEGALRAAEKLIWILTLFVYGMERETHRALLAQGQKQQQDIAPMRRQMHSSLHHEHTIREYADAAKSSAKVLFDFTRKTIDPQTPINSNNGSNKDSMMTAPADHGRRRKGGPPPPPPPPLPGRGRGLGAAGRRRLGPPQPGGGLGQQRLRANDDSSVAHEKPLLQIGDVLQRTRTFLADVISAPAALLRGEVIALLCDILDVDSEMELSEEEAGTPASGAQAGPINDLGSAGSLLKLMVLNCPVMRSPVCEELTEALTGALADSEWAEEVRRKLGTKEVYSAEEIHRLHAGNRFLAVVHRLAASRSMSARITACSLAPVIWAHLDFPHQLQLRGVITRALHDVEVMVRKATANVLHEIAELVFDARCVPWLVLMCERAMTDPEPQLRAAAMTLTWHLAEHLPNTFLGDASQGSRYLRRLPDRNDPIFADVYLLQCKLLPVATRLAEDRSPSVRLAVAAQCDRLCDALGDHWSSVVIDVLLGLLSDPDERVRCEAVMCVPRLASIVLLSSPPGQSTSEVSILEALVPASIRLQGDNVSVVRVALAAAAGELLTLLVALQSRVHESGGTAATDVGVQAEGSRRYKKQVDERLIPLVQNLLNDQDPEVTSAALRAVTNASRKSSVLPPSRHRHQSVASEDDSASVTSMHSHATQENRQPVFLPVLSEVQVLRLLPTLSELADGKQWRVRQSAVEIVPALLGCTYQLETRTAISKLCVRLMSDNVDAVRKTAAECLCMGGSSLGSHGEDASAEWFSRIVIPAIRQCASHQNAKQRLLSLKMVEIVLLNGACPNRWKSLEGEEEHSRSPTSELVAIALLLAEDRIPNVRLNVGRVLESVLHLLRPDDLTRVIHAVTRQLEKETNAPSNGDRDVLFFARKCVEKAKALQEDISSSSTPDAL